METAADTKTYCKSSSNEISEKHHIGKPFHFSPLSADDRNGLETKTHLCQQDTHISV